ncbi:MAG: LCP family protein [Acidimicrobiia bacterium]|nr:LCP family protein [Acidimicrobiia bacterium]
MARNGDDDGARDEAPFVDPDPTMLVPKIDLNDPPPGTADRGTVGESPADDPGADRTQVLPPAPPADRSAGVGRPAAGTSGGRRIDASEARPLRRPTSAGSRDPAGGGSPSAARPQPTPRRPEAPERPTRDASPSSRGDKKASRPARARSRRRPPSLRRLVRGGLITVAVLLVLSVGFGWWQFSRIERVPVGDVLSTGGEGTNYLIVGTDSRDNIDPDAPDAGAFLDGEFGGARADTIILLRTGGPAGSAMLSIPRDLWVVDPVTGEPGRINSTYVNGPVALIGAVQSLGLPVHHYMEVDFVSFGGLVDALGGVTIPFEHPARDEMSGLFVEEAGEVVLDGTQALAYVRSRQFTQLIDGEWRTDPTGDIGRTERQRLFLTSLLGKLGGTRNPWRAANAAGALGPGMRLDDSFTFLDALRFGWAARGLSPDSVDLPVFPRTTSGGAAVLELQQPEASDVIARFSG